MLLYVPCRQVRYNLDLVVLLQVVYSRQRADSAIMTLRTAILQRDFATTQDSHVKIGDAGGSFSTGRSNKALKYRNIYELESLIWKKRTESEFLLDVQLDPLLV